jgi:protein tyrosine phosphatase (PTP) superfamily phosphohydrolase (DUF442 family)
MGASIRNALLSCGLLITMVFKALRLFRATKNHTPLYWLTYHLAIAPQPWRHEWPAIHEAGVRGVVDLRSQTQDDTQAIQALGMTFRHAPVYDGEAPEFATLLDLTDWVLDQQALQGPVLVHCREGRGRSAMVGCAVLIRMGISLPQAYRAVRSARGDSVSLSDDQVDALELFAKYCLANPRMRYEQGARYQASSDVQP